MSSEEIYQKRLNRAIDYISTHLGENIPLAKMAEEAGFSSFHFHRIFSAALGETPADYLLRLRLEMAANYLIKTRRPVTQIALECGFSSPAGFARAFRQRYRVSPRQYRSSPVAPDPSSAGDHYLPARPSADFVLEPARLVEQPDRPVVYAACYDGYNLEKICLAWERVRRWAALHNLLSAGTRAIGISFDDPQITQKRKCRYFACLTVPAGVKASGPVGSLVIPGGLYAVFHAVCRSEDIAYIYHHVYRTWLPSSGCQTANSFPYEEYIRTPGEHPRGCYEMQVGIPVEPV